MLNTKKILQENLKALLATRPEISRLNLSREMKVGDGTLGSIQYGKGNPTIEILEAIAVFFELETWRLLCPNLGQGEKKTNAAVNSGSVGHWPFTTIKPADFKALPQEDRDEIEHQIVYKIKRLKGNGFRKKKV